MGLPPLEKTYIVSKFFVWILEKIVIIIIKSYFYQTYFKGYGHQPFYFPKNKMESLSQKVINSKCNVMPSSHESKGSLKILPKKSGGVRPLFKGKKKKLTTTNIQTQYDNARLFLRYLVFKEQKAWPLTPFCDMWKNAITKVGKEGKLYFVKTDIKNAFSSVDVNKLLELLRSATKGMKYLQFNKYGGKKMTCIPNIEHGLPIFPPIFQDQLREKKENSLSTINVQEILKFIEASLQPCVQYRNLKIKICEGLPQGCPLSTELCNFFYASMTSLHLDDLTAGSDGAIIRTVDDFLYISRSLENTQQFHDRMMKGIHEFNCYINEDKTLTNIGCQIDRFYFNGYIICLVSECILVHVSYMTKTAGKYSLTFNNDGDMKTFVQKKLNQTIGCCLPYQLIVPGHTNLHTLLDNVWRTGIICGIKLHALVAHAEENTGLYKSSLFAQTVLAVINKIFNRIRNYNKDFLERRIFTSLLVCSIFHSLNVIAPKKFASLKDKLRCSGLANLKNVKPKEKDLKKYLKFLLTND